MKDPEDGGSVAERSPHLGRPSRPSRLHVQYRTDGKDARNEDSARGQGGSAPAARGPRGTRARARALAVSAPIIQNPSFCKRGRGPALIPPGIIQNEDFVREEPPDRLDR